jgi:AcrR family transcriptional regulator
VTETGLHNESATVEPGELEDIRRAELEDIRRAELIEAAIRLIAAKGYAGASVRKIASAADASVSAIHYYFSSKEALLAAAFRRHNQQFYDAVGAKLEGVTSATDRLRVLIAICFPADGSAQTEWTLIMEIMQHAPRHQSVKVISDEANAKWIALIIEIIESGVSSGEFRPDLDPPAIAIELAAVINGFGFYLHAGLGLTYARAVELAESYLQGRIVV